MDKTETAQNNGDVENADEPSLQVSLLILVVLQVAVLEPGQFKEATWPYGDLKKGHPIYKHIPNQPHPHLTSPTILPRQSLSAFYSQTCLKLSI